MQTSKRSAKSLLGVPWVAPFYLIYCQKWISNRHDMQNSQCARIIQTQDIIFRSTFSWTISEFFNENYIAGEKIENVDQTELYFALIIPEIDFPLNFA